MDLIKFEAKYDDSREGSKMRDVMRSTFDLVLVEYRECQTRLQAYTARSTTGHKHHADRDDSADLSAPPVASSTFENLLRSDPFVEISRDHWASQVDAIVGDQQDFLSLPNLPGLPAWPAKVTLKSLDDRNGCPTFSVSCDASFGYLYRTACWWNNITRDCHFLVLARLCGFC